MTVRFFEDNRIRTVSDALDIAEDKTGDYYKFSNRQWKKHSYDVKTQLSLEDNEITSYAFALLNKCALNLDNTDLKTKTRDFYFICLQDDQILKAMKRDSSLKLLPLLVYILTHELVHIVRFCNFSQRFEISGEDREDEEKLVHSTTYDILKDVSILHMDYILEAYRDHRICDLAVS